MLVQKFVITLTRWNRSLFQAFNVVKLIDGDPELILIDIETKIFEWGGVDVSNNKHFSEFINDTTIELVSSPKKQIINMQGNNTLYGAALVSRKIELRRICFFATPA